MKIAEFSKVVNLNKKTIHYYIECGLIKPKKLKNNYYEFDNTNIKECETVKIYRNLGFSINTIINCQKYPTFINYFLYETANQIKQELYHKQLQLENIRKLIDLLPPNATSNDIENLSLLDLNDELIYPCISNQYPINTSYLLCLFLLVPWVRSNPNHYRKFIFTKISDFLYDNLKEAYNYLEHLIYTVDISDLNKASEDICYLMLEIDNTDNIKKYNDLLYDKCYKLIWDDELKNKWLIEYYKLIKPTESFYNQVSELLFNEFCNDLKNCQNNLKEIFDYFIHNNHELIRLLKNELGDKVDFNIDKLFNDLYMILIFDISFYAIEDNDIIKEYL